MDQTPAVMMSALQGALLEAALPHGVLNAAARKAVTGDLAETFGEIVRQLSPDLVLEIGAHGAQFSRQAKADLPDARVVAFEANPEVFARQRPGVDAAGVEFVQKCVAAEERSFEFHVPMAQRLRTTMGSLRRDTRSAEHVTFSVEGVRLDTFLGADRHSRNVMWIDVEGAIGDVLDGAPETLAACVALYAEVEVAPRWAGQRLDGEVIGQLAALDFVPVLRDVQRQDWQYNALFVKAGELTPAIRQTCAAFLARQGERSREMAGGLAALRGRMTWLAQRGRQALARLH